MLESGSHVTDATDEDDVSKTRHRGSYQYLIPMEKAEYGRRAAECGLTSTIKYFPKVDKKEQTLSPSTLLGWKENYLEELAKRKNDELPKVKEQPPKKHYLLGTSWMLKYSCISEITGLLLIQQL